MLIAEGSIKQDFKNWNLDLKLTWRILCSSLNIKFAAFVKFYRLKSQIVSSRAWNRPILALFSKWKVHLFVMLSTDTKWVQARLLDVWPTSLANLELRGECVGTWLRASWPFSLNWGFESVTNTKPTSLFWERSWYVVTNLLSRWSLDWCEPLTSFTKAMGCMCCGLI